MYLLFGTSSPERHTDASGLAPGVSSGKQVEAIWQQIDFDRRNVQFSKGCFFLFMHLCFQVACGELVVFWIYAVFWNRLSIHPGVNKSSRGMLWKFSRVVGLYIWAKNTHRSRLFFSC